MRLILTGEMQVGKSTLADRLIAALGVEICGFRTVSRPCSFAPYKVSIIPAEGLAEPIPARYLVGIRHGQGRFTALPQTFEDSGVALLQRESSAPLLLLDELGVMESAAPLFQAAVVQAFAAEKPLLAVIKPKSTPFLNRLRAWPGARLVEVTAENRDALLAELLPDLRRAVDEYEKQSPSD